ncbi:MAG TPA: hypothetical protein VMY77_11825 [Chitinophagaceae bacterium]|nr:hypothetical protein [Chitinophagaceae bacterium]
MAKKTTCSKCDNQLEPTRVNKQAYCMPCHAEYMRGTRPTYPELTPEQKKKDCARSYLGVYIRRGKVTKQPCEKCGNEKAEGHHENYDKPLEVQWLCRECHLDLHYGNRGTSKKQTA